MNRTQARIEAGQMFPMDLYGTHYESFSQLVRKDRIASIDLLDHIQWNEPIPS